jgi:hypothetical protein
MKMIGHATAVFDRAGRGAAADTWKAAPPVAALIAVSNVFSFASPDRRGVLAVATIAASIAAAFALWSVAT